MSDNTAKSLLSDRVVPKLCGSDVELGNFIVGADPFSTRDTCAEAARALLVEVQGHARHAVHGAVGWNATTLSPQWAGSSFGLYGDDVRNDGYASTAYRPHEQDYGRKFLPSNSGCIYIDLNHLEICTPECICAFDHLAASRAMLSIARDAMNRANQRMPAGATIKVLANNSDGRGHSYGSHLNFLVTRECFDNILHRKMHYLQFLASFEAASIVLSGAGKVGSENGMEAVKYQISARADFMETMVSEATTYARPLVNSRNEAHAGAAREEDRRLARLHVIVADHQLCHCGALLRAGMMQVVLCMLEQGQVPIQLLLDEPVAAIHDFSRDPALFARAMLVSGARYTAVELLQAIHEEALRFVQAGRADGLVPRVREIMTLWGDCLEKFRQGDMEFLAARIDWVAKQYLLERAASKRGGWEPARLKYLDDLWSSLDSSEGLYWAMEKAGAVQRLVTDEAIERFMHDPPDDTRAWLRSWALRHLRQGVIGDVNWDVLRLRIRRTGEYGWPTYDYLTLSMANPLGFTRSECQSVLESAPSPLEGLRRLFGAGDSDTTNSLDSKPSALLTAAKQST